MHKKQYYYASLLRIINNRIMTTIKEIEEISRKITELSEIRKS